jgi:hypothetical protein
MGLEGKMRVRSYFYLNLKELQDFSAVAFESLIEDQMRFFMKSRLQTRILQVVLRIVRFTITDPAERNKKA